MDTPCLRYASKELRYARLWTDIARRTNVEGCIITVDRSESVSRISKTSARPFDRGYFDEKNERSEKETFGDSRWLRYVVLWQWLYRGQFLGHPIEQHADNHCGLDRK